MSLASCQSLSICECDFSFVGMKLDVKNYKNDISSPSPDRNDIFLWWGSPQKIQCRAGQNVLKRKMFCFKKIFQKFKSQLNQGVANVF